jgi:hypothetical protein
VAGGGNLAPEAGAGDDRVQIAGWICAQTLENPDRNPRAVVVVRDPDTGRGFQLAGEMTVGADLSVLDGVSSLEMEEQPIPQVERQLRMRVTEIMHFTSEPHGDAAL